MQWNRVRLHGRSCVYLLRRALASLEGADMIISCAQFLLSPSKSPIMKPIFFLLFGLILAACSKSNNKGTSGLSTADQLVGTWYLDKQVDTVIVSGTLD